MANSGQTFRFNLTGFPQLTPCGKFLFNGCLDANGNRNEANCAPRNKPEGWEEYRGLADSLSCTTSECLCRTIKYNATCDAIRDAGVLYCSMRPSIRANPDSETDDVDTALATICAGEEFPPDGCSWTYKGKRPGSLPEDGERSCFL